MANHEQFIQRCLDIAILGAGSTSPNPMVGAVVVFNDKIIGEGYTSPYGGPHAEVNAIQSVRETYGEDKALSLFRESIIYVSLEPCAHFGKTPPCADLLVSYAPKMVVIGCLDPFAKVNGMGVAKLRKAGIDVVVGVLEAECKKLNRRFFTSIEKFRPYIILKWAETADGFFAPDDNSQRWISNENSKQLVHKWRSEEDAILIGANTAVCDNPFLNTRLWHGKSPKRILIDKELSIDISSNIYNKDNTDIIVFNALKTEWNGHLKYIQLENFDMYLPQNILYQLYLMDIKSLIVEGGVKTIQRFLDANLWDEARVILGNTTWSNGIKAPQISQHTQSETKVGDNLLQIYSNK